LSRENKVKRHGSKVINKIEKMSGGSKVEKKSTLVLLLFQWCIFSPYRFLKLIFGMKLHFFYFLVYVLERIEEFTGFRLKRKKIMIATIPTTKKIEFVINRFCSTRRVWWWLFRVLILPEKTNLGWEKKFLSSLTWCFWCFLS
jgi:hypothetical protein